jgi:hypothetical protein
MAGDVVLRLAGARLPRATIALAGREERSPVGEVPLTVDLRGEENGVRVLGSPGGCNRPSMTAAPEPLGCDNSWKHLQGLGFRI